MFLRKAKFSSLKMTVHLKMQPKEPEIIFIFITCWSRWRHCDIIISSIWPEIVNLDILGNRSIASCSATFIEFELSSPYRWVKIPSGSCELFCYFVEKKKEFWESTILNCHFRSISRVIFQLNVSSDSCKMSFS